MSTSPISEISIADELSVDPLVDRCHVGGAPSWGVARSKLSVAPNANVSFCRSTPRRRRRHPASRTRTARRSAHQRGTRISGRFLARGRAAGEATALGWTRAALQPAITSGGELSRGPRRGGRRRLRAAAEAKKRPLIPRARAGAADFVRSCFRYPDGVGVSSV